MDFCKLYQDFGLGRPLIVVPSSFDRITETEFEKAGVNIVIYANHMLRAAYPAMLDVEKQFLRMSEGLRCVQNVCRLSRS